MDKKTKTTMLAKTAIIYLICAWQKHAGTYYLEICGWSTKSAKEAWGNYDDYDLENMDGMPPIPFLLALSIPTDDVLNPELIKYFANPEFVATSKMSADYQKKISDMRDRLKKMSPTIIDVASDGQSAAKKPVNKKPDAKKPITKKSTAKKVK